LFDGDRQIEPPWFGTLKVDRERVVDPSPRANSPLLVEHEDFRRAACSELIGHAAAGVFEHRQVEIELRGELPEFFGRVLDIGIDQDSDHAGCGEAFGRSGQSGRIEPGQRAFGPKEADHDQRGVVRFVQRPRAAVGRRQRERFNPLADFRLGRRRCSSVDCGRRRQNRGRQTKQDRSGGRVSGAAAVGSTRGSV